MSTPETYDFDAVRHTIRWQAMPAKDWRDQMTRFAAIALCGALAGCGTPMATAPEKPLPPARQASSQEESATVQAAIQVMRGQLNDSDSAQFQSAFVISTVSPQDGAQHFSLCGEIKAKNGYGAYTGWKWFIVSPDGKPFFQIDGRTELVPDLAEKACSINMRSPADHAGEVQRAVQAH